MKGASFSFVRQLTGRACRSVGRLSPDAARLEDAGRSVRSPPNAAPKAVRA